MSRLTKTLDWLGLSPAREEKAFPMGSGYLTAYDWNASALQSLLQPTRVSIDYGKTDPCASSAFQACLNSICRAFPDAPPVLVREMEGDDEVLPSPATDLLMRPNPFYTAAALWQNILADYYATGNGFALIERNGRGIPIALHQVPAQTMRPKWEANEWISYWERMIDGKWKRVEVKDVLHFRNGQSNNGPGSVGRLGLSPIYPALSDIFTDDEATAYVATILSNQGVTGSVFSPKADVKISPQDRQTFIGNIRTAVTGAKRGSSILLPVPMDISSLGVDPAKLDLTEIQMQAESRICSVMCVPPAVAGLRVGTKEAASNRSNYEEAQCQFWENCLVPLMSEFADVLTQFYLPQFYTEGKMPADLRIEFDLTNVKALQENADATHKRACADFRYNLVTRNEARAMVGMQPLDGEDGDVFWSDIAPAGGVAPDAQQADAGNMGDGTKALSQSLQPEQEGAREAWSTMPPQYEGLLMAGATE